MTQLFRSQDPRQDVETANIYASMEKIPIGAVMAMYIDGNLSDRSKWPNGWLCCNSSFDRIYPVSEYSELAKILGPFFRINDTTFRVPGLTPITTNLNYFIKAK